MVHKVVSVCLLLLHVSSSMGPEFVEMVMMVRNNWELLPDLEEIVMEHMQVYSSSRNKTLHSLTLPEIGLSI